jgi:hypothetical protein
MDEASLGRRLGIPQGETHEIVEELHEKYLVDVVSGLEGKEVKERLRLTEEGEATLLRSLEQMCELPEFSRN